MPVIGILWDSGSALAFESPELFTSGVHNTIITVASAPVIASGGGWEAGGGLNHPRGHRQQCCVFSK